MHGFLGKFTKVDDFYRHRGARLVISAPVNSTREAFADLIC